MNPIKSEDELEKILQPIRNYADIVEIDKAKIDIEELITDLQRQHERELVEARIDELNILLECRNVADKQLINMGTEVWVDDRIAELQQTMEGRD